MAPLQSSSIALQPCRASSRRCVVSCGADPPLPATHRSTPPSQILTSGRSRPVVTGTRRARLQSQSSTTLRSRCRAVHLTAGRLRRCMRLSANSPPVSTHVWLPRSTRPRPPAGSPARLLGGPRSRILVDTTVSVVVTPCRSSADRLTVSERRPVDARSVAACASAPVAVRLRPTPALRRSCTRRPSSASVMHDHPNAAPVIPHPVIPHEGPSARWVSRYVRTGHHQSSAVGGAR